MSERHDAVASSRPSTMRGESAEHFSSAPPPGRRMGCTCKTLGFWRSSAIGGLESLLFLLILRVETEGPVKTWPNATAAIPTSLFPACN